jgi:Protein of unknown function (DUF3300)
MLRRKLLQKVLWSGNGPRLAMAVLLFWTTAVEPVLAQTSPPPGSPQQTPSSGATVAAPHYSMEDLSYLLEPIALYPDPLLALILSATTFPVQIVEAERWIAFNPISVRRGDFSEVDAMDWDSSVKALARFPDVVRKLADHLDWTESLGIAVATQTSDVTAAIQLLRAKAESLGNLQSTPEQTVATRDEGGSRVIYVLPANPERIYVPVYDPGIVFSSSAAGAIAFGFGVLVGSAWNSRWGWNNRRWNQVWITPPAWHPPPPTWRPPHRPGGRPPVPWRPDRPGGNRPERPGGRPERPGRPGGRPEIPSVRPERPGGGPESPNLRPERPGRPSVRPETPNVRPERPGGGPESPNLRPERPGRPGGRPETPNVRPERPGGSGARPEVPSVRPERPSTGPQTPGGAARPGGAQRPGNAARPGGGHRHQPGARPHQPPRQQSGNAARPGAGHRQQTGARPHQPARGQSQHGARPRPAAGAGAQSAARQGNQGQRNRSQGGGRSRQE